MLKKLLVVALGMFGFGFALVPFYNKMCEVAGLRELWQPGEVEAAAANTQVDLTRTVTIEFDSNIAHAALDVQADGLERAKSTRAS